MLAAKTYCNAAAVEHPCQNCYKDFCTISSIREIGMLPGRTWSTEYYQNNAICSKKLLMDGNAFEFTLKLDTRRLADSEELVSVLLCNRNDVCDYIRYKNQVVQDWVGYGTINQWDVPVIGYELGYVLIMFFSNDRYNTACYDEATCKTFEATGLPQGQFTGISITVFDVKCKNGYGDIWNTGCMQCREGTYNGGSGVCDKCQAGTVQPDMGMTSCTSCSAGKYWVSEVLCKWCPFGMYQDQPGKTSCIMCPGGTYGIYGTGASLSEGCASCQPGKYNAGRSYAFDLATRLYYVTLDNMLNSCTSCEAGKYQDAYRQTTCISCPVGTVYASQGASSLAACQRCAAGQFSDAAGTKCYDCAVGKYTGSSSGSVCQSCLPGSYAGTTGSSACSLCEPGTYINSSAVSSCLSCAAGTFSSTNASLACAACPSGKISWAQSTTCYTCPAGKFSATSAVVSYEEGCVSCPAGKYSSSPGSITCTACPEGTYSGSPASTACYTCGPGARALVAGTGCVKCEPGTYYDKFNGEPNSMCIACAAGTASAAVGATSNATCKECRPGTHC